MLFNSGNNPPKTTAATLGTTATPGTPATGFTLSTPTTNTLLGATAGGGFSLGGAGDSKSPGQIAAVKPVATASSLSSFALSTPTTTTNAPAFPSFGLTSTASSTTSAPINFGLTATAAPTTAATLTTTTASSSATALGLPANTTFLQLQETIKKWTDEFNEQEKIFMNQSCQINNLDNLLRSNSDKILELNDEVAAMKLQQQKLTNELEFIQTQQRELEEVLAPLERQTADVPTNSDPEREHTYHMAETLDTQLKQMCEDLREIIENLNESSRTQDNSDPIVQVGRILNAHMNSLHWIDQMTLNIQNQLENVTKLHDTHRRENERLFRISYD